MTIIENKNKNKNNILDDCLVNITSNLKIYVGIIFLLFLSVSKMAGIEETVTTRATTTTTDTAATIITNAENNNNNNNEVVIAAVQQQLQQQGKESNNNINIVTAVTKEQKHLLECLDKLPEWAKSYSSPKVLKDQFKKGSNGLTDKSTKHSYQHMYQRYFSPIAQRVCHPTTATTTNNNDTKNTVRILEIGLGCSARGGMIKGTPGGSALAWNHLFPSTLYNLDLHIIEFDSECAMKWSKEHPTLATVHPGDATDPNILSNVIKTALGDDGNNDDNKKEFDIIIDDGSHLNKHQIQSLEYLIPYVSNNGGVYVVEDIHASCRQWNANTGKVRTGLRVQGTPGCMETKTGDITFYGQVVEWQKKLIVKEQPFPNVNHIDLCYEAAVFQKTIL